MLPNLNNKFNASRKQMFLGLCHFWNYLIILLLYIYWYLCITYLHKLILLSVSMPRTVNDPLGQLVHLQITYCIIHISMFVHRLFINHLNYLVMLSQCPSCPYVRLLVDWLAGLLGWLVVCHNFLRGQNDTLPCSF